MKMRQWVVMYYKDGDRKVDVYPDEEMAVERYEALRGTCRGVWLFKEVRFSQGQDARICPECLKPVRVDNSKFCSDGCRIKAFTRASPGRPRGKSAAEYAREAQERMRSRMPAAPARGLQSRAEKSDKK